MTPLPNELNEVEQPFIAQLRGLGWEHLPGDLGVPELTGRSSFREVLLKQRLRAALRRINTREDGEPWIDDARIEQAIARLDRIAAPHLLEANAQATELLLTGAVVDADPGTSHGKSRTARFIDFDRLDRNEFLVVSQLRVDPPGAVGDRDFIVPDLVLFVNGIPLVVVECKSPSIPQPMDAAIEQLLRYSNQRGWIEADEGAERLFHTNQLLVATWFREARAGTIGATAEHYLEWKDTSPVPVASVAKELGVAKLRSQELLVAGMLRPAHLLDLVRNFTVFGEAAGRKVKLVARYQQFRAVHEAVRRLSTGATRKRSNKGLDERGGIVWHTQGSGKSLTMVFLVRKLRTLPALRPFKVVIVTDRIDLEDQLAATARLSGDNVQRATSTQDLMARLRESGPGLVFGKVQLVQDRDDEAEVVEFVPRRGAGLTSAPMAADRETETIRYGAFPVLNESERILLLVDEAHRSHTSTLHLNLMEALPNAAKIGFTGTPILMGARQKTHEIFGSFIDRYTIRQSEADQATVPILYELRAVSAGVAGRGSIDQLFDDLFRERSEAEREAIRQRFATVSTVLEAPDLIARKAEDMLRHYVDNVLPNGFKAQVVATSRLAAVRYQQAFVEARARLLARIEALSSAQLQLTEEELDAKDPETQFLVRAARRRELIEKLEMAAVISGSHNQDPAWDEWSDKGKVKVRVARFKKPLVHEDPSRADPLAILSVKSMLLTGFDAPVEQVLYLDRFMQGADLLQAIARVNRTAAGKTAGLVVDYFGVGRRLRDALAVYAEEDVEGAATDITAELPRLEERHANVLALFHKNGVREVSRVNDCVDLLRDNRLRADFIVRLKAFLAVLELFRTRPEGRPYLRDAKLLGFIAKMAANLYRDEQLDLAGVGHKVRELIDEYVVSKGIDPKVPPISITSAGFLAAVDGRPTKQSQASEMEHAARFHIDVHFGEDPAHYRKLSERLEAILARFRDSWEELVEALRQFTKEVQAGRPADETNLDPRTQAPFLSLLVEELEAGGKKVTRPELLRLAGVVVDLVEHVRQEIRAVDFWRTPSDQAVLRRWVIDHLDDADVFAEYDDAVRAAGRLMELAKVLHSRLTG